MATHGTAAGTPTVDGRVLHRVRSLLAKAESTTFPDEAEALTAKAQELMARHAIDAALLDAERGLDRVVATRRLTIEAPYAGPKAMLIGRIASANRCRAVWSKASGEATVFGADGDLDAVELLYTSLLVQAARAMLADGAVPGPGSGGRTRSFRQSFLVAFAVRIGERLREVVEAATVASGEQHANLLPVLADRKVAVDAACEAAFPRITSFSASARDVAGWLAGQQAADTAQLDVHGAVARRGSRTRRGLSG